jgi:hypothetical protein
MTAIRRLPAMGLQFHGGPLEQRRSPARPGRSARTRAHSVARADGFVPCSTRGSSTGCWSRWWRGRSLERSGGSGAVEHPGLGGCRRVTHRET